MPSASPSKADPIIELSIDCFRRISLGKITHYPVSIEREKGALGTISARQGLSPNCTLWKRTWRLALIRARLRCFSVFRRRGRESCKLDK